MDNAFHVGDSILDLGFPLKHVLELAVLMNGNDEELLQKRLLIVFRRRIIIQGRMRP